MTLQNENPIKLLTSGPEIEVAPGKHFFAGGKWRFVDRDRWWLKEVDRHTVVGHYWRRRREAPDDEQNVWNDIDPFSWSGKVFCVDYSVGKRFVERARGQQDSFEGALAALLWPERTLVFDDRTGPISTL